MQLLPSVSFTLRSHMTLSSYLRIAFMYLTNICRITSCYAEHLIGQLKRTTVTTWKLYNNVMQTMKDHTIFGQSRLISTAATFISYSIELTFFNCRLCLRKIRASWNHWLINSANFLKDRTTNMIHTWHLKLYWQGWLSATQRANSLGNVWLSILMVF